MAGVSIDEASKAVLTFYNKGITALEHSNFDYAMDMFEAALNEEPRLHEVRKLLRTTAIKKSKTAQAGKRVSSIKTFKCLMRIRSLQKKDPIEAISLSEELLRDDPLSLKSVLALCHSAQAANLPEIAVQTLEIVCEHLPTELTLLEPLADLYYQIENFKDEYGIRKRILNLKPNDSAAQKRLKDAAARTTMNQAGWDQAKSFRSVIKNSDEAEHLERSEKAVQSSSDIEMQIQTTQEKIEQQPDNVNYRRAIASLYLKAHKFPEARETLEKCQALSGGADPQIDQAIADLHIQQFDYKIQQETNTQKVEKLREDQRKYRFENTAERVMRYPNDLQLKYNYGLLLYENNRLNDAIVQLQAAQRSPSNRVDALYHLARCFKEKKQYDIAIQQLEIANKEYQQMDETKKKLLYELGETHELNKESSKSIEYYKAIYALDISYKNVAEKIDQAYSR